MDRTKLRNGSRESGTPLPVRGTCLSLWKRGDLRDALWAARAPRRHTVTSSVPAGVVRTSRVDPSQFIEARDRRAAEIRGFAPRRVDLVQDAWVGFVQARLGQDDVCFFSGSYRDDVGYANGLMLARNVQRDFKRFLAAFGFDSRDWVCAVEKHPSGRDVLHCHALVSGMTDIDMALMEHEWTDTRGWSKAVRCHDGGVRYTCKYALKGAYVEGFEWSW